MVHGMDALSAKWRDDPVRAALEKKQNREAAADRQAKANAMASELLKKRLAASSASAAFDAAEDEQSAMTSDADYRKVCIVDRNPCEFVALDSAACMPAPFIAPWLMFSLPVHHTLTVA
jgi:hypothetical protein